MRNEEAAMMENFANKTAVSVPAAMATRKDPANATTNTPSITNRGACRYIS